MHLKGVLVFTSALYALVNLSRAQMYEANLKSGALDVGAPWFLDGVAAAAPTNSSLPSNGSSVSGGLLQGFCFLGMSVLCFGTAMVPLQRVDVGDGVFFQLVFCSTMALEALLVFVIRGCPHIWALNFVSGMLYSIGNFATVPIIKTIGLGMGSLIWSVFALIFAWATARFGWFGIDPQDVPNPTLNYVGTAMTAISSVVLLFLKTGEASLQKKREDEEDEEEDEEEAERKPLLKKNCGTLSQLGSEHEAPRLPCWYDQLSPVAKRILGSSLAVFSGMCFGLSYTPIIYIKNSSLKNTTHFPGASQFDLDYLFPHMIAIDAVTTFLFVGYCFLLKNRPHLPPNCVVPAFASGSMQFMAYCAFFESSYYLGTIVTYPIGSVGPALIALLWSVFYFKEIQGLQNFIILAVVIVTVVCGVTLITLSKIDL